MRSTYNTRYVRMYGACGNERANFVDDIVEAAYEAGMGVVATVWLGCVKGFRCPEQCPLNYRDSSAGTPMINPGRRG